MEQFAFPKSVAKLLSLLPSYPPSFAFTKVLNLALGRIAGSLAPLHGKHIAIHVNDIGLRLLFTIEAGKFTPTDSGRAPDLSISASAQDFYLLATRKEDPDTLFFSRRLMVEGDTELGLVAKNTLDAIELPKFTPSMLSPRNVVSHLKSRLFRG
jgi:predicted lipid carrier protein YhbT